MLKLIRETVTRKTGMRGSAQPENYKEQVKSETQLPGAWRWLQDLWNGSNLKPRNAKQKKQGTLEVSNVK